MNLGDAPRQHRLEGEQATRAQHAPDLAEEVRLVFDVHQRVLRPDHIERSVREGHVPRIGAAKRHFGIHAKLLGEHARRAAILLGDVDSGDPAAELGGKGARGPAYAASHVEDFHAGFHSRKSRELPRRLAPAAVELVEGRQVFARQLFRILAGFSQPFQNARRNIGRPVMAVYRFGVLRHHNSVSRMAMGTGDTARTTVSVNAGSENSRLKPAAKAMPPPSPRTILPGVFSAMATAR